MRRSQLAEPPIRDDECHEGNVAICRYHGGRIAHSPTDSDRYGNVYYCPVGGMAWRYTRRNSGMLAPLRFPRGL